MSSVLDTAQFFKDARLPEILLQALIVNHTTSTGSPGPNKETHTDFLEIPILNQPTPTTPKNTMVLL